MAQIIVQPTGSPSARAHYRDTIASPVVFADFEAVAGPNLSELQRAFPNGKAAIWGVVSGPQNITKWNRIEVGDLVLFAAKKRLFARGVVRLKFRNEAFSEALWGRDDAGRTWEYMYAIDDVRTLDLTYLDLNRAVGYKDNNPFQGFLVLDSEKSSMVLGLLDLDGQAPVEPEPALEPLSLEVGNTYSWDYLANQFRFSPRYFTAAGGIPVSSARNAVLVVTHPGGGRSFDYGDYWDGSDLIYTGRGQRGDQKREGPNRDISENRKAIYAFESVQPHTLRYLGSPLCVDERINIAPDRDGSMRRVLEFRLRFPSEVPKQPLVELAPPAQRRQSRKPEVVLRTPRKVDRDTRPTKADFKGAQLDYTQIAELKEKADATHYEMLRSLDERLERSSWINIQEIPGAIDLWAVHPSGQRVIFEIKSITPNNETSQCRSGLAQLLEYRVQYGEPHDDLCLMVNAPISQYRARVLNHLGVGVIVLGGEDYSAGNDLGYALVRRVRGD